MSIVVNDELVNGEPDGDNNNGGGAITLSGGQLNISSVAGDLFLTNQTRLPQMVALTAVSVDNSEAVRVGLSSDLIIIRQNALTNISTITEKKGGITSQVGAVGFQATLVLKTGFKDNRPRYGSVGDDVYTVNSTSDKVFEFLRGGTDTVKSSIDYRLGTNIENLTLTGTDNINGTGNRQDNVLTGNNGSNVLNGLYGADTLDGGSGNDILNGGMGDDRYIFGVGDGTDKIIDVSGNQDVLAFRDTTAPNVVAFFKDGDDLQVGFLDDSGLLTIQNERSNGNSIDRFELSDGQYLTRTDVNQLIQQMSAYASENSIDLGSISDVKGNTDLMNIIAGSWHTT